MLDAIREDGDEPSRREVARVDHLVFEVGVKVGLEYWDQSVKLVEEQLQHRQIRVEQLRHAEPVNKLYQGFESHLLILEDHQQEPSNEVHALAVLYLLI